MRVAILIQARLSSGRLPKKILADVGGEPMIRQLHTRMQACKKADAVLVACPEKDVHEIEFTTGLICHGGPEEDLLTRLLGAAQSIEADMIVRVTGDCPLACPLMIGNGIHELVKRRHQGWAQNWEPRMYPDGFDLDIWRVDYLKYLDKKIHGADREYFASWCIAHKEDNLKIINEKDISRLCRVTVDYQEDLDLVREVYREMRGDIWTANEIISFLVDCPEVNDLNKMHIGANNFGAKPE